MVVSTADPTWPEALAVSPAGVLRLEGCDLSSIARGYGTPAWVVSKATLERNFDDLQGAFRSRYARCEVAFSIKAHNTLAVIRVLHDRGAKLDCSAEHEFRLALLAGLPAQDIILNGNGKSEAALRQAAALGVRQVNIDSLDEALRLERVASELETRVPCCVRIQLGYQRLLEQDPGFETTLRVGEGKFGNNVVTGAARRTVEAVHAAEHLDFVGLSHHVGFSGYMGTYTPEHEVMHHREATREVCEFANAIRRDLGTEVKRLDLGGGFRATEAMLLSTPGAGADVGIHALPASADYATAIFSEIETRLDVSEPPLVQFESGGGLVADAVVLLTEISEIKDVTAPRRRRYISVDASMMMFVSRGMMRVGHPVVSVDQPTANVADVPVELVGQTCVYDSIAEDVTLPEVGPGDVLAVINQGAYCETQSTQFNGFPRPPVLLVDGDRVAVVKRRETFDDIHARDVISTGPEP
jgi:diaminopimelate decarboxylase